MARIWYDATGAILRVCRDDAEEARYGAPAAAAGSIWLDEVPNASVLDGLAADWNSHACPAGVLIRDGVPVQIAPDGRLTRAVSAGLTLLASSTDAVWLALRVVLRDIYARLNDERESRGLPRIQEPETVARLLGSVGDGAGAPLELPTP